MMRKTQRRWKRRRSRIRRSRSRRREDRRWRNKANCSASKRADTCEKRHFRKWRKRGR